MTPTQHDQLRAVLERTTERFFQRRSKLVTLNGQGATSIDATGLLAVLSGWVGDLIKGAPEHMRDDLFMAFADSAATIAGIKEEDDGEAPEAEVPETIQ